MASPRTRLLVLAGPIALAAVLAGPLGAEEKKPPGPSLDLRVEDEDGTKVQLRLATGWLSGLVDSIHVDCRTESAPQSRKMMESLDAAGEGAVYSYVDDRDGDRVLGRRARGQLVLETRERDGGGATIEMPWPAARCLMLGIPPEGDFGRRIAEGKVRLRLDVRDHDDRVQIRFE
jgi:hypothetical protein